MRTPSRVRILMPSCLRIERRLVEAFGTEHPPDQDQRGALDRPA
ncbi:hypothetical protein Y046_3848 [Burkholderia pseudomallei MSHR2990]|nr:hypothetical protein Y046_3848 [Burkholderia pseudomallei MSHR2990]